MNRRFSLVVAVLFSAALILTGCASQQVRPAFTPADLTPAVSSGKLIPKVENFVLIMDESESMNDAVAGGTKFFQERSFAYRMNGTLPELKLKAVLRNFGDNWKDFEKSKRLYGLTDYTRSGLDAGIDKVRTPFGPSPLETAIDGTTRDLQGVDGRTAVIILTDGEDMDQAPVKAAANLKSAYGDRVCIYTVQLGNSPVGKKILDQIAAAGGCGFATSAAAVASSEDMGNFVEQVFFTRNAAVQADRDKDGVPDAMDRCPDSAPGAKVNRQGCEEMAVKAPAQAPAKVVEKKRVTLNVKFDTNKAVVKKAYHNEIGGLAEYLKMNPESKVVIEGHTDNVGNANKNLALSQKRADSVKQYLISKFKIDASRVEAKGFGETKPIADNATSKGRQINRRVEAVID